jgi:hypothetical protein
MLKNTVSVLFVSAIVNLQTPLFFLANKASAGIEGQVTSKAKQARGHPQHAQVGDGSTSQAPFRGVGDMDKM